MTRWIGDPLVPGEWKDLGNSEVVEFARLLGTLESVSRSDAEFEIEAVRAMPLACFRNALLIEVQADIPSLGEPGLMNLVLGRNGLVLLTGSSVPIHQMSAHRQLDTEEQARSYFQLFCNAVHAPEGRFRIICGEGDMTLQRKRALHAEVRDALEEGLTVSPLSDANGWAARAPLQYGDMFFVADFALTAEGGMTMESDRQPDEKLRLVPERWHQHFRLGQENSASRESAK